MNVPINAKRLRATLPDVVERVRKGTRFTVIYRSRPAFQIVPVDDRGGAPISLAEDPLYRADAVGSSDDGCTSNDHDAIFTTMNAVFVDTGGWMACADRSDPAHVACTAARDATLEAGRLLITTDFVVDETLTLIRFRLGLAAANTWWQQIDGSARLRWERVENDRFERARNLFFQYRDKDLSFTDCTSFAVMRELRLTTVITTDGHFRQVGFDVLPATRHRIMRKPPRS